MAKKSTTDCKQTNSYLRELVVRIILARDDSTITTELIPSELNNSTIITELIPSELNNVCACAETGEVWDLN